MITRGPDHRGVWNSTSFTVTDESRSGRLFRLVARLDGSVSAGQLAEEENVPREDVEALIDHLLALGVLEATSSNSLDYYLDNILPWQASSDAPLHRPIIVLGDNDLALEIQRYLRASLHEAAVTVVDQGDPAWATLTDGDASWLSDGARFQEKLLAFEGWRNTFLILATKVINPVRLRILNRVCLDYRIPWVHAAMDGPFLFIGPTFIPHRSACYECLDTRVMMNLRESGSYQQYKRAIVERQVKEGQLPVEPAISGIVASHTALETLNFALTESSFTVNKVLAIYLPTMEFTYNEVLRAPGCPACSPIPERDDKELYADMGLFIDRSTDSSLESSLRKGFSA